MAHKKGQSVTVVWPKHQPKHCWLSHAFFMDKCLSQLFLWDLRLLKFIFHALEHASTCMKCIFIFSVQNIYFKCQSKHRCQHNQQYIAQFKKKKKKLISIHHKRCLCLLSGSRCSTEGWKLCVRAYKAKHPHTMHMNVHIIVFHELEWLTQK